MSFSDNIDDFLDYMRHNRGRSPRLAEVYRLALSRLEKFMTGLGRNPLTATPDDLIAFTGPHLFSLGQINPLSRRTHISAVRGFFLWAKASKLVAENPALGVPQPKVGVKIPRTMRLADIEKLMWAPDFSTLRGVRDAAMFAVLAGCGLRASGLINLNESNVVKDTVDGLPRLFLKVMEKGSRERVIPIPEQAALLLQLYMEHPELHAIDRLLPNGDKVLFTSFSRPNTPAHEYHGEKRRIHRKTITNWMKHYGIPAGIDPSLLHPHALRHAYGTELAEDDIPTVTAQRLMGHADPKSTSIYQQLALRKLTKVVDRSNPLAKIKTPVSALLAQIKKCKA
ncbi:MAG: tyrosine-type recombinase/integrase [Xanthomonadales bacterium]|jgi:site-specific recombinase XerD|nr:tyrosine-type recombinase/integrase [Xanthomonadales bacterium]